MPAHADHTPLIREAAEALTKEDQPFLTVFIAATYTCVEHGHDGFHVATVCGTRNPEMGPDIIYLVERMRQALGEIPITELPDVAPRLRSAGHTWFEEQAVRKLITDCFEAAEGDQDHYFAIRQSILAGLEKL